MDRPVKYIVEDILKGRDSVIADVTPIERRYIIEALKELNEGDTGLIDSLWSIDFERKPIVLSEFLSDDYYFGKVGKSIYPEWKKELGIVLDPANEIFEWVNTGCIGGGKTTVAVLAILYKIYYLSCMRSPQDYYNMIEKSPIIFGLFNIFKYLAFDTSWQYFDAWLKLSPYFRKISFKDDTENFVGFPHNMGIAFGAQAIHALGQNIWGGLLDEANFGKKHSMSSSERGQVYDLYLATLRRMVSRFMEEGGCIPGLLILASSATVQGSFLDKHSEEVLANPRVHVSNYALYEIKSEKFGKSGYFYVSVGNRLHSSKIIKSKEEAPEGTQLLEVPVEFLEQYKSDLDSCIRDISGVSTFGVSLLLPRRDLLYTAIEHCTVREHPFNTEHIYLGLDDDVKIEDHLEKTALLNLYDKSKQVWRPKFFRSAPRCIHVDLAKNGDAAGFAMGCISTIRTVERFQEEQKYTVRDHVFFLDLMLRIYAVAGSEIDFSKIREFIFFLRECGFNIVMVSYDGFQSVESLQELHKAGFNTKTVSVDKGTKPYHILRTVIIEGRIDCYHYEPFVDEVINLRDYSRLGNHKPLIDHPEHNSKDVADAVCGVVFDLSTTKRTEIKPAKPPPPPVQKYGTSGVGGFGISKPKSNFEHLFPPDEDDD